jgi:regulator of sigma E protease
MDFLTTTGAFILVLGVIIFFHEFGHFITAKLFGIRVFIFSFGFGQRLWGFKWGETDCRVSLVPLGGYVKLEGEGDDRLSEDTSARGDGKDFSQRPRWQRFLVYFAGPVMNGVLATLAFAILFMVGYGVDATLTDPAVIGTVAEGSPAAGAGLQPGDQIVAIDGKPIRNWEDGLVEIALRPEARMRIRYRRAGVESEAVLTSTATGPKKTGDIGTTPIVRVGEVTAGKPAQRAGIRFDDGILSIGGKPVRRFDEIPQMLASAPPGPVVIRLLRDGSVLEIPVTPEGARIGIGFKAVVRKFGPLQALRHGARETWNFAQQTVTVVRRLLTAQISPKAAVAGPLGIAQASGEAARDGLPSMLFLIATLSVSVGILNLFPLAPLDGGHLAIILLEGVLRRDFSLDVKAWIMNTGAMVLFVLIGLVLYFDLSKTSWLGQYLKSAGRWGPDGSATDKVRRTRTVERGARAWACFDSSGGRCVAPPGPLRDGREGCLPARGLGPVASCASSA